MRSRPHSPAHVLIVGGGGTGGALAHDLALRGLRVTLVERGELTSGTTGRHHGLLHSGAAMPSTTASRRSSASRRTRSCGGSARARSRRTTGSSSPSTRRTSSTSSRSSRAARRAASPPQRLTPAEALRLEPNLNPELKVAVRVPDATMDAMRMPMRFFATARHNGAEIRPYTEVDGPAASTTAWSAAPTLHDHVTGKERRRPRRHRRQRHRAVVGEGRRDGRRRRADPAVAGRPARRARPPVQHGRQPAAQVGRRRHRRARSAACRSSARARGSSTTRTTSTSPRTTSRGCTPRARG